MSRPPTLKSLRLQNILSFGDQPVELELGPLNVLIGPNGSGKSNLIEVISLLRAAPRDLGKVIREGGGVQEWLWKGAADVAPTATIDVVVDTGALTGVESGLRYGLAFTGVAQRLAIQDERIVEDVSDERTAPVTTFFSFEQVRQDHIGLFAHDYQQSVLSQRKDPQGQPELTHLGQVFDAIGLFRDWRFGHDTKVRRPQSVDLPNDHLLEDVSNLGLVLNTFRARPPVKRELVKYLKIIYDDAEDVDVRVEGGTVQVFLQERDYIVPASRLSDGTLRWLALLTILLHPSPPPLVCIEEPELGLHPDLIATLADLLREASQRMQLVVTTHSSALVDALSDTPDAVVVCDKVAGATRLRRLLRDELAEWLADYDQSLGELWSRGFVGGNRW